MGQKLNWDISKLTSKRDVTKILDKDGKQLLEPSNSVIDSNAPPFEPPKKDFWWADIKSEAETPHEFKPLNDYDCEFDKECALADARIACKELSILLDSEINPYKIQKLIDRVAKVLNFKQHQIIDYKPTSEPKPYKINLFDKEKRIRTIMHLIDSIYIDLIKTLNYVKHDLSKLTDPEKALMSKELIDRILESTDTEVEKYVAKSKKLGMSSDQIALLRKKMDTHMINIMCTYIELFKNES